MDNYILKSNARSQLAGRWSNAVLATLIITIITAGLAAFTNKSINIVEEETWRFSISISGLILGLVSAALDAGMAFYTYSLAKDEPVQITDVFWTFRTAKRLILILIIYGFTLLWSLLFIIPGIIASYRYRLAPYILMDNPNLEPMQALDLSKEMMIGRKLDLFVLDLSFLGWMILMVFTCGLGALWLSPYMMTTTANFYLSLPAPLSR